VNHASPGAAALAVELIRAGLTRGGRQVLADVSWRMTSGEHWAVLGPNGAGKSSFLSLLRGDLWPSAGRRVYVLDGCAQESPIGVRERMHLVSADMLAAWRRRELPVTAREAVASGFGDDLFLYRELTAEEEARMEAVARTLGLANLLERDFTALSHGQAARVLLARAVVRRPDVLILDEFADGLDAPSRRAAFALLGELAADGVSLVVAAHRPEDLPPDITMAVRFEAGRLTAKGRLADLLPRLEAGTASPPAAMQVPRPARPGPAVFRLEHVSVALGGRTALYDVSWVMRPGESWAVLGANGAGKSTLVKLLAGELHPLPGGSVSRFGRRASSLWDIRRRVGLVSFDLQNDYPAATTALDAVVSGFFGHLGLYAEPSPRQEDAARRMLAVVGLAEAEGQELSNLSYGQQRRVLIARALAPGPRVLLLDEPLSGLDAQGRGEVRSAVERLAGAGVGLVLVSHAPADLVPAIGCVLALEAGRVMYRGDRAGYAAFLAGNTPQAG